MYKQDLALDNLYWFICHKTKPNQTKPNLIIYTRLYDFKLKFLFKNNYNFLSTIMWFQVFVFNANNFQTILFKP